MNALSPIAGIGHNSPPPDAISAPDPRDVLALMPRLATVVVAREFAPHTLAADVLLDEHRRFLVTTAGGIETEAVDEAAVDFAKDIKDELDRLDATHSMTKAPVLAAQRAIDGAKKAIVDPLVAARTEVQRRHTTFLRAKDEEIRRQAREEANRAEEAAWRANQIAEETGDPVAFAEAALAHSEQRAAEETAFAPVLETTRMKTATGNTSGLRDNWIFEVTDLSAVPSAYLSINEKVVKAAIASGNRSIPGLRIFNDPKAR